MGSGVLQFLSGSPSPLLNHGFSINKTTTRRRRCRHNESQWDSNAEKTFRPQRFTFNIQDDDESFTFNEAPQKRVWWSDDINIHDDEEDDDDDFGSWEASLGFTSIFKVFRAFGWMVPAIGISMLLGTGPNAFFMALALPLAQSALSLVTDTLGGRWADNPSPRRRSRPKKRPFVRSASNAEASKEKEQNTRTDRGRGYYKGNRNTQNFGGWDDLDRDRRGRSEKVPLTTPTQKANEPIQQKKIKLSRRVRNREKPLLLRLLIAVFPFLGSWTKLL